MEYAASLILDKSMKNKIFGRILEYSGVNSIAKFQINIDFWFDYYVKISQFFSKTEKERREVIMLFID